jgi:general secretion pathway protein J
MGLPRARARQAEAGFTMFDALVAIALMGLILGALATVTAQWLPNWARGLVQVQRNEQVATALDRLAADLSAAEYVSPNRSENTPLFRGAEMAVIFVRSAVGPNSPSGLEIVQIAETIDSLGPALVRTRAPFVLLPTGDPLVETIRFADPVVLLRAPPRIAFAYAGPDGKWTGNWRNSGELPTSVRFDVRDAERGLVMSTATRVHAEMRAPRPDQINEPGPEATQAQSNNAPEVR